MKKHALFAIYFFVRLTMVFTGIISIFIGNYEIAVLSFFTLFILILPSLIEKKLMIDIPSVLEAVIVLFIFCSIFLGEISDYYTKYPYWDTLLHTQSGFIVAALGLSVINSLNKSQRIGVSLNPLFIAVFTFCFALAIGVLWEIYEYAVDNFFGYQMQKPTILPNGNIDVGLIDTMEDLIVSSISALLFSIYGYLHAKFGSFNHFFKRLFKK